MIKEGKGFMGNIVEITDFDDSKLDIYARLSESRRVEFLLRKVQL